MTRENSTAKFACRFWKFKKCKLHTQKRMIKTRGGNEQKAGIVNQLAGNTRSLYMQCVKQEAMVTKTQRDPLSKKKHFHYCQSLRTWFYF